MYIECNKKLEVFMAVTGFIFGLISMISGIIIAIFSWKPGIGYFVVFLGGFSLLFGINGIILSAVGKSVARRRNQSTGLARAGLALSIVGTIFSFIGIISSAVFIAYTAFNKSSYSDSLNELLDLLK